MFADSNFLVPNGTFIVVVLAFVLLLYVIGRRVLPVVNQRIAERQESIKSSLEQADAARHEAEETRSQRQGILDEARQQAREIVASANRTAEQTRADAQTRGQQEYDRLVASAQVDIDIARQRAIDEISAQVGSLVLATAERVIEREMDAARHRDLVDEAVAALRSGDADAQAAAQG